VKKRLENMSINADTKKISFKSFSSFVYSVLNYNDNGNGNDSEQQQPMKRYFIYYIILYIWMIRMAMSVVGLFGPIGYSIYRKINPKDIEPTIHSIVTLKWYDYLNDINNYMNLGIPFLVSNVPILSSNSVLYLLKEHDSTNTIYASNQTLFTDFNDNTIWTNIYNITPSFIHANHNDIDVIPSSLSCRYSYDKYLEPIDDPLFQAVANSLIKSMTTYTDSYKNHRVISTADIYQSYCPNITFAPRYSHHCS